MKNIILFSFALAMMASSSFDAIGIADTTQVHGINEVVVTGTNQATGKTQLLAAISGEVPSLFVSQRNIFGFGVSNGGSGGIKLCGVGGSPTSGILMMVDGQPQFAGLYSHPVADFYEMEYVDHVEVVRGRGDQQWLSDARLHRHGRCEGKILTKKVSQQ